MSNFQNSPPLHLPQHRLLRNQAWTLLPQPTCWMLPHPSKLWTFLQLLYWWINPPSTPKHAQPTASTMQTTLMHNNSSPASRSFHVYFNMQVTPKSPAITNPLVQQCVNAYNEWWIFLKHYTKLITALLSGLSWHPKLQSQNCSWTWPASELQLPSSPNIFRGSASATISPFYISIFWVSQWCMRNLWSMVDWCLQISKHISTSNLCRQNRSLALVGYWACTRIYASLPWRNSSNSPSYRFHPLLFLCHSWH